MLKKCVSALSAVSLIGLTACDNPVFESNTPPLTNKVPAAAQSINKPTENEAFIEHLTGPYARTWVLQSRIEGEGGETLECYLDDKVIIYRDYRITFDVGVHPCFIDNQLDKTTKGSWRPTTAQDMFISIDSSSFRARVLHLDDKTLTVSFSEVDSTEITETYTRGEDLSKPVINPANPIVNPGTSPTILN